MYYVEELRRWRVNYNRGHINKSVLYFKVRSSVVFPENNYVERK
jgi:hypothetical protein